jgi:hypothetical protein
MKIDTINMIKYYEIHINKNILNQYFIKNNIFPNFIYHKINFYDKIYKTI